MSKNRQHKTEVECISCGLYHLCQLAGLDDDDHQQLDSVVERRKKIAKDHILFDAGESFRGIFAVKSGAFKMVMPLTNDKLRILDFYIPGELIGLEAINRQHYQYQVVASENSSVCEMDLNAIQQLKNKFTDFQTSMILALTNKVRLDQQQTLLITAKTAEQRLAIFLSSLTQRLQMHGLPASQFQLPIIRKDIANYLGMATETIIRVFKVFETQGLIETRGRNIKIIKLDELNRLAALS